MKKKLLFVLTAVLAVCFSAVALTGCGSGEALEKAVRKSLEYMQDNSNGIQLESVITEKFGDEAEKTKSKSIVKFDGVKVEYSMYSYDEDGKETVTTYYTIYENKEPVYIQKNADGTCVETTPVPLPSRDSVLAVPMSFVKACYSLAGYAKKDGSVYRMGADEYWKMAKSIKDKTGKMDSLTNMGVDDVMECTVSDGKITKLFMSESSLVEDEGELEAVIQTSTFNITYDVTVNAPAYTALP